MTPLLEEYFNLLDNHRKELNDKNLLLLMQVGSFYEAYEMEEPQRGCAKIISNVLRMHLTKKNGKLNSSENNPWMVGFPTYVLGKHLTKLNDEGYSVAVYEQTEENRQERVLKGIYSYSIRYENEEEILTHSIEPKIFGLRIEKYNTMVKKIRELRYLISMVVIEMNSGKVSIYENDTEDYQRDVQNFILNYNPSEIVSCLNGFSLEEEKEYREMMEQSVPCKIIYLSDELHFETKCAILEKIYDITDICHLGIERHNSIIEIFVSVLEYIKKHDPLLVTKLQKPEFIEGYSQYMHFNRDVFLELNIMSICERRRSSIQSKKQKSVLDILSRQMTTIGKRYFENIIRRPLYNASIIEERWKLLDYLIQHRNEKIRSTSIDLEWYLLKWKRDKLSIKHVGQFLKTIKEIYHTNCVYIPEYFKDSMIPNVLEEIETIWNIEEMKDESVNFFVQPMEEMLEYHSKLSMFQKQIKEIEDKYQKYFKLCVSNENDYHFQCTLKKWESYQYEHKNDNLFYILSKNKTNVKLSFETLDRVSFQYKNLLNEQNEYISKTFKTTSKMILERWKYELEVIITSLTQLECFYPLAIFFMENHYTQPQLRQEKGMEIKGLRHMIYESIEKDKLFVPYDIELSNEKESIPLGMLIYGMNSSGKSTLLKSVGCCLWLSQCGLYVPANYMSHSLLDGMYSKMGTYDNLFIGHSTFVAEMSELNYILKKATSHSLLLCDELTSGTETKSATGIVTSSLLYFLKHKIPFLLTTHLHLITQIEEISKNPNIRICHFEVTTTTPKSSNCLLSKDLSIHYDRILKDGSGNDVYGIEIAKTLGLPSELIQTAYEYRDKIDIFIHENDKRKVSKYNKKLIVDECFQCKSRIHLQTHHITPQEFFEKENVNRSRSKNGLYNLVVLCENCHSRVHHS
jgi:DNA mismatch repair protein MutS